MPRTTRALVAVTFLASSLALNVSRGDAHKPITSPYTYNDDIFPILRDRCGRCHVSGGVAPMSLMTHADAVPWGESIKTELLAGYMPPAGVDGAPTRFRNAPGLSPREMNLLLTWVTGGTPLGSPEKDPPSRAFENLWPLGSPDVALQLPEFTIGADAREQVAEFVIPTGIGERRAVRAVDLLPGAAAMVRAATISVRAADETAATTERTLAVWLPGDDPIPLEQGFGFELPASAELLVRVLYRKTWEHERKELRDRSIVGLYFAPTTATTVQALRLSPDSSSAVTPDRLTFRRTLAGDARALAIYPEAGLVSTSVRVVATRPDGTRAELIAFHPRPDWARRFWFQEPIDLPRGTTIDVSVLHDDETPLLPLSVAPAAARKPDLSALRLTLNTVSAR